jgi:hypothetical protein
MTERSFYGYLEDTRHTPEPVRREPSPAELRVLRCLAHGMNVPMAAEAIGVSTYTAARACQERPDTDGRENGGARRSDLPP